MNEKPKLEPMDFTEAKQRVKAVIELLQDLSGPDFGAVLMMVTSYWLANSPPDKWADILVEFAKTALKLTPIVKSFEPDGQEKETTE